MKKLLVLLFAFLLSFPVMANDREILLDLHMAPYVGYFVKVVQQQDGTKNFVIRGNIVESMAVVTNTFIEKYPDINSVYISSAGGDMTPSRSLGNIFRKYHLTVLIKKGDACLSACAYAALYAHKIIIQGQLGFHTPYFPNYTRKETLDYINKSSRIPTLRQVKDFFKNRWHLYLLYLIIHHDIVDKKMLVFDRSADLERFKLHKTSTFVRPFLKSESVYELRTYKEIEEYSLKQRKEISDERK